MEMLEGFPYFEVEFDKKGKAFDPKQIEALTDYLATDQASDLFVISHGWNNDMADARGLYKRFFVDMRKMIDSKKVPGIEGRKFAIMAVLWPSAKFADQELIPGGAAGADSPITTDMLRAQLDSMKGMFNTKKGRETLDEAKKLIPKLEDSPKAQAKFADLLRSLLPKTKSGDVDAADDFASLPGNEVMQRLSRPVPVVLSEPKSGGGASMIEETGSTIGGGAAGGFFSGVKWAAQHLLNLTTYYQMKERSGLVGSTGVNEILRTIRAAHPGLKLHLIGHSFGGRLVTAAIAGTEDAPPIKVDTLTLLQAAFSHYGFAQDYEGSSDGFFRRVITEKRILGPALISCTPNDKAVGMAYPLASLLAGQVAASIGDKNDKYGGIGRNGAQKTPEASDGTLLELDGSYKFQPGKLHNLQADAFIKGHSDICHPQVAYAILNAVAMT
jgi:hypothetical protein